ncbi:DUF5330 domain-containing protein [Aurantimonas sp. 22II-16-19i]|uniref:DUF5330 domain-containing protein n=1 Tax=Aurantimonas sp. 22II-16-19i TaxID=1317114 RepID=UPI0009F7F6FE|nr:DUF5330 domain-containing protein [Aurantimonas sp. 22II-16-19i]ORE98385.1 hypothetical protein ATO4_02685 [Aurantimonas sp. 22II-16-19i]
MIRFVIKMAFFLGLIAMLVPGGTSRDGEPEINLFAVLYGAQAAMSDLSSFCDRAPSACAAGGDVARFAGERVSDGLALAYDFVDDAVSKRRRDEPETPQAVASQDAAPQSRPQPLPQAAVPAAKARDEAAARADRITTAAIPLGRPTVPGPAPETVAIPADRAQDTLAARPRSPMTPSLAALATAGARPLPAAPVTSRRMVATVPVPAPAPRG